MNSLILIPLSAVSWIFTLVRFKAILRQGLKEAGAITLYIWGMLFSFTITITFLIVEFATVFDAYTFPNLALLVYNSAFLVSQYFGMVGIIAGMGIPTSQRIIRWMTLLLGLELLVLLIIYLVFVSKIKTVPFAPQSFPEVMMIAVASSLGIVMSIFLVVIQLRYFPAKKFALMRLRATLIILCILAAGVFLLSRIMTFVYYPSLMPPVFIIVFYVAFISATLLFFSIFLSNQVYARVIVMFNSIESWHAFQDLKRLVEHLTLLCPMVVGLSFDNPNFWQFFLNPEYHLYRAVIIILDNKILLSDFLGELTKPGMPPLWEETLLQEAIRVNQALQTANPSNDFADIVETYRRVSRDLFASQKELA